MCLLTNISQFSLDASFFKVENSVFFVNVAKKMWFYQDVTNNTEKSNESERGANWKEKDQVIIWRISIAIQIKATFYHPMVFFFSNLRGTCSAPSNDGSCTRFVEGIGL